MFSSSKFCRHFRHRKPDKCSRNYFSFDTNRKNSARIRFGEFILIFGRRENFVYSSITLKKLFSLFGTFVLTFLLAAGIFAAPGNLDRTFGTSGKAVLPVTGAEKAQDAIVQPDGKIVVVGGTTPTDGNWDFLIQRYNSDGTLDANFGNSGNVVLPIGTMSEVAYAVTLQSDGKIVAVGYIQLPTGYTDIGVVRLLTDGQPDQTFGTAGVKVFSVTDSSDIAVDVEMQTLGGLERIIVGSYTGTANTKFSVARLTANGELDATFGDGGVKSVAVGGVTDILRGIAIDSEAKIVAAGSSRFDFGPNGFRDDFAIVRFFSDGHLDTNFGNGGKVITQMSGNAQARSVVVQQVGNSEKYVIGGFARNGSSNDFALARYNDSGTLDTTFGANGKAYTNFPTLQEEQIHKLLLQSDQKVIGVGFTNIGSNRNFALARYNTNGALDTTFGSCGTISTELGTNTDIAYGATLQPDGKIIAVGESVTTATSADFAIVRYTSGGQAAAANADFDGDGKEDVAVYRPSEGVWYMNCSCQGFRAVQFGLEGDIPQAADYDGDGRTDQAVYRGGTWYIKRSSDTHVTILQFGLPEDIPTVGDYDGDEKADISVWRPSTGVWYVLRSSDNNYTATEFGLNGDRPVAADYDGDGLTDLAIYRNGGWWIKKSSDTSGNFNFVPFGVASDKPLTGDFDGDGKSDFSVYRASEGRWYQQLAQTIKITPWGIATDTPVAADYDGDGKTDIAVYRDGYWYIRNNVNNSYKVVRFGLSNDIPVVVR